MTITAKFSSICPNCNMQIAAGERVSWTAGSKASHIVCADVVAGRKYDADDVAAEAYAEFVAFAARFNVDAATGTLQQPVARLSVEDAGVYVLPNGDIVKVQANKEKTRTYAKRWVVISGERLTEADTREHGEYQYEAGLVQQVATEGRKMRLEEAKAFIIRYGQCARCSRQLKAAESVERGIGPVCLRYFSTGTTGASLVAAPQTIDDSEDVTEQGTVIPVAQFHLRKYRWTRASDDELEHAAGYAVGSY
jgi:hypothetical protein